MKAWVIDPHVVSVSSRGFVAVANQTERSVSLLELNRRGELNQLRTNIPTDNMVPRTLAWRGHTLFVALDAPSPLEDVIRTFRVVRRVTTEDTNEEPDATSATKVYRQQSAERPGWTVEQRGDTPAGVFLTDLEAFDHSVVAVTANLNNPADPTAARNEVRVYRIGEGTVLTLDASVQTGDFPPSFKQVSTARAQGPNDQHVIVTEFQAGWLRSIIYNRGDDDDEEEDED